MFPNHACGHPATPLRTSAISIRVYAMAMPLAPFNIAFVRGATIVFKDAKPMRHAIAHRSLEGAIL